MILVTDTHAVVWLLEASSELSQAARAALNDESAIVVVPTICLAEVKFLY
jgi:PIN domain nuclease of toxin-antitoxin system